MKKNEGHIKLSSNEKGGIKIEITKDLSWFEVLGLLEGARAIARLKVLEAYKENNI